MIYKPGKSNLVADALSRLKTSVNYLSEVSTETASEGEDIEQKSETTETASEGATMHSADQDSTDLIPHVEAPSNVFRNQIIFRDGIDLESFETPHPGYTRHYLSSTSWNSEHLKQALKLKLKPNVINGIKIPEHHLAMLQDLYINHFSKYNIRVTQKVVQDITSEERRFNVIEQEHKRAHRNPRENVQQILDNYYFPQMYAQVRKYATNCEICKLHKYDRKPVKPEFQLTPNPTMPCEILHMDIMEIQNQKFISVIDKFSKFAKFFHISDRSLLTIREKLVKILHYFTAPKILVTDNESSFISPLIMDFLKRLGIKVYLTPSQRSEVNGQVERLHSTILEIYRCLKAEFNELSVRELIYIAIDRYNNSIHSVTGKKPDEVFINRTESADFNTLLQAREKINKDLRHLVRKRVIEKNRKMNRMRTSPRKFRRGEEVFVRIKNIKAKNKPLYKKEVVARDNKVTIVTEGGRKIHKAHIKNISHKKY